MSIGIQCVWLGRVSYADGLALQQEMAAARVERRVGNVLLLLEHPAVITLGRNARREHLLATEAMLAAQGIAVYETNRGGDVTYHGPGQLVGYPIFDLHEMAGDNGGRLWPVEYVRRVEEVLMRICAHYGLATGRVAGRAGVWVGGQMEEQMGEERKIAAVGVHVARGITTHGFALNVTTDLSAYQWIVPCGIADREVTSLARELGLGRERSMARELSELSEAKGQRVTPTLAEVATVAARCCGEVFGEAVVIGESLSNLRERMLLRESVRQVGVPMTVPPELKRVREVTTAKGTVIGELERA